MVNHRQASIEVDKYPLKRVLLISQIIASWIYHIFFVDCCLDPDPTKRAELVTFWENCIADTVSSNLAMIQGAVGDRESSCLLAIARSLKKDNHSLIQDI
jgi:hypothetical protein